MDGHPHRFSTDFEQTLLGVHLTRRVLGVHSAFDGLGKVQNLGYEEDFVFKDTTEGPSLRAPAVKPGRVTQA
jgi:hypothetical protein